MLNRYKFFVGLYNRENFTDKSNKLTMFLDACYVRIIFGIHFEEYFRNQYYNDSKATRKNFTWYANLSNIESNKIFIFLDYLLCRVLMNIRLDEYFRNRFFNLCWKGRREYLTTGCKNRMMRRCNNHKYIPEIDDKVKFNRNFSEFLKRDWIDLATCSKSELVYFSQKHPKSFCKFSDGLQGIGARKIDFNKEAVELFYNHYSGEKVILEDLIVQHSKLAEINKATVNTIRVVTFVDWDNNPHVIGAALRMGRLNQVADNFHMNGIAASIDINTGIVESIGIDSNFNQYIAHPDSKVTIPGFKIPYWNQVVGDCCKAAMKYPGVRYVGWDVAIREDDICFVEGNSTACPDVLEMPVGAGIWKRLKPFVAEIKK